MANFFLLKKLKKNIVVGRDGGKNGFNIPIVEWIISWFLFFLVISNFLKFKFIYFNWRLITLQCCIGFAIHQHEFLIVWKNEEIERKAIAI